MCKPNVGLIQSLCASKIYVLLTRGHFSTINISPGGNCKGGSKGKGRGTAVPFASILWRCPRRLQLNSVEYDILCSSNSNINKRSPASAKGNSQQRCMFESSVRTKSKLTHPSNEVVYTRQRAPDGTTVLAQPYWHKMANFFSLSSHLAPSAFRIYEKALRILILESSRQHGEDLVILACTVF